MFNTVNLSIISDTYKYELTDDTDSVADKQDIEGQQHMLQTYFFLNLEIVHSIEYWQIIDYMSKKS